MENPSRRRFLEMTALAATGIVIGKNAAFGAAGHINGVQLGVITYSFRSMPGSVDQLIQYCKDCKIDAVELMGDAIEVDWKSKVDLAIFKQVKSKFSDAGISIYAFKPRVFGKNNTDAEIDYAIQAAKTLGASHVTTEFPEDRTLTKRYAEIAGRHEMFIGYHGHLQQTYEMWDEALQESKWNAINLDMGHYVAAGFDPIPFIKAKHDRIVSMHVKDRKNKEHGGENMPWGQGDTPIAEALQLMAKSKYKFPATIELEYDIPSGSDAVKEVAKCVEFAKKALNKSI